MKRKRDDRTPQPDDQNRTWNPGGIHKVRTKLFKIAVSSYVYSLIGTISDVETDEESRTELDSHANMAVVGRHAFIISDSGRTADVNQFTPDCESMQVPIVDAGVLCECPYN
jgi:D-arabinose 5-phosphate isomerase GutQ